MKLPRSKTGLILAALYLLAYAAEYVDYLRHEGTWLADLGLNVLSIPFILVGRMLTGNNTFEVHGYELSGVIAAVVFDAVLVYWIGAGIAAAVRYGWERRRR